MRPPPDTDPLWRALQALRRLVPETIREALRSSQVAVYAEIAADLARAGYDVEWTEAGLRLEAHPEHTEAVDQAALVASLRADVQIWQETARRLMSQRDRARLQREWWKRRARRLAGARRAVAGLEVLPVNGVVPLLPNRHDARRVGAGAGGRRGTSTATR